MGLTSQMRLNPLPKNALFSRNSCAKRLRQWSVISVEVVAMTAWRNFMRISAKV